MVKEEDTGFAVVVVVEGKNAYKSKEYYLKLSNLYESFKVSKSLFNKFDVGDELIFNIGIRKVTDDED